MALLVWLIFTNASSLRKASHMQLVTATFDMGTYTVLVYTIWLLFSPSLLFNFYSHPSLRCHAMIWASWSPTGVSRSFLASTFLRGTL